jgi:putative ABC transport system permease protein
MGALLRDLQYARRQLLERPVHSAIVILTLALGIGANTAVFSILDTVLLRPLPYAHGDRLVHLGAQLGAGRSNLHFSVPELADFRRQARSMSILEYHSMTFSLVGHGEPDRVQTGVVSSDFFDGLGVRVARGRGFVPADERMGADHVLLLTDQYWRRRFGGDPAIVGKALRMNGRTITVIGVLPPLPPYPGTNDVYMPTTSCPFRSNPAIASNRGASLVQLWGRLKPGATAGQAQVEATTILGRLRREFPQFYRDPHLDIPVVPIREEITSNFRASLLVLFGVVVLVLLITCANLANLTLARLMSREREITLRAALGADRRRILRQLLTESTVVGLLGGLVGLALAAAGIRGLALWVSRVNALGSAVSIDGKVLLFTLAVSLATGLVFGLLPALQASRGDLVSALKEGGANATAGAGKHRLRGSMIVAQVALSFVLLVMAGLTLRSLANLRQVDAGFKTGNVLTMVIDLPFHKYQGPADFRNFFGQLVQGLEQRPEVVSAALTSDLPLEGAIANPSFDIQGAADDPARQASLHLASEGFFQTLGVPVLAGRPFDTRDGEKAPPVVVVNQSMARRFWPHRSPLDARIRLSGGQPGSGVFRTVVGVVGDVRQRGLAEEAGPAFYLPFAQQPVSAMELLVRTRSDPVAALGDVRSLVAQLDPEQPIAEVQTLAEVRSQAMASPRLTASLLGLFASLAFVITAIGIGGVISYSVTERTHEIGIRAALGARRLELLGLVMRGGLALIGAGLLLGAAAAAVASQLLASLLFGIQPVDGLTFAMVALFLLAIGTIACLLPARRAASIDPLAALRG